MIFSADNQYPKISIVTPSFNQGQYLEKTIQSVLNQNYPNLEYIIIDGGSTDNSVDIIKKYEKQLTYWVSEKDKGQSDAINKGLRRCTGDIVAWLNSDDYYEADTFEQVILAFKNNPTAGVICGNCQIITIDDKGLELSRNIVFPQQLDRMNLMSYWKSYFLPPQPSMFWLKKYQDKTSLVDEKLHFAMDLEFWLQLSKHTKFAKIDHALSNYLLHVQSKSGSEGGFKKFKPEWKLVINRHLKEQGFKFRFIYFKNEMMANLHHFFTKGYKKLPIQIVSGIIPVIKKVTGIKQFGLLSKHK